MDGDAPPECREVGCPRPLPGASRGIGPMPSGRRGCRRASRSRGRWAQRAKPNRVLRRRSTGHEVGQTVRTLSAATGSVCRTSLICGNMVGHPPCPRAWAVEVHPCVVCLRPRGTEMVSAAGVLVHPGRSHFRRPSEHICRPGCWYTPAGSSSVLDRSWPALSGLTTARRAMPDAFIAVRGLPKPDEKRYSLSKGKCSGLSGRRPRPASSSRPWG